MLVEQYWSVLSRLEFETIQDNCINLQKFVDGFALFEHQLQRDE